MENIELKLAEDYINKTNKNVFITGKAGTGKTTLLKHIVKNTHKNVVITSPTGVAAINAGGVTLHSFFQLPFEPFIPTKDPVDRNIGVNHYALIKKLRFNKDKIVLIRELETLIIDEISMVRADTLDAIDVILKNIRAIRKPFGGVQVVLFGDMFQLPPIIKDNDKEILKDFYKSPYFFDSHVLKDNPPIFIELKKIYRQTDEDFISILNNIRNSNVNDEDLLNLNKLYQPNFKQTDGYITLTTHNHKANKINEEKLNELNTPSFKYKAKITGKFNENLYPVELEIELKVGAQVMFIKNDSREAKQFYNGKIGKVIELTDKSIVVECAEEEKITVPKEKWEFIEYETDLEGKAKENILGEFEQYPLRLAWAVTVHKSQGLTFEKVIIDVGQAFASGQVYVALSRCKSLEGIVLDSKIHHPNIISNPQIIEFHKSMWKSSDLQKYLDKEKYNFNIENLIDLINFDLLKNEINNLKEVALEKEALQDIKYYEFFNLLSNQIDELKIISDKFETQIFRLYNDFDSGKISWDVIEERAEKAINYFYNEFFNKIYLPLKNHQNETLQISGLKTYQKPLKELLNIFERKQIKYRQFTFIDKLLLNEPNKKLEFIKNEKETLKQNIVKNTFEITLNLLKEKKSIQEISKIRNLSISTIEGHCSKLIKEGKIDVEEILSPEIINPIKNKAIELNEFKTTTPIYVALDSKHSFSNIRMVLSSLK